MTVQSASRSREVSAVVGPNAPPAGSALRHWIRAIRPRQWVKNFFIFAPALFSGQVWKFDPMWSASVAFLVFCGLASTVYLFNDVMDREADSAHPVKRLRPIAAGLIAPAAARTAAIGIAVASLTAAFLHDPQLGGLGVAYLALNLLYSAGLKRVVILDVFIIASFFVIRLLAGAWAVDVPASIWLLLCGGLLALYLAFAKRRHELELLSAESANHRLVLGKYSTPFLDQMSVVLLASTIISYVLFTRESTTARLVGSDTLSYSTVFVLFGVSRYLFLVHQKSGGDPAESLLTDRTLLVSVVLWAIYCAIVVFTAL